MIFPFKIKNGFPVKIRVTHYRPGSEIRVTGSGFGDADPPEPPEFEYDVLLLSGHPADFLEISDEDDRLIFDEFERLRNG